MAKKSKATKPRKAPKKDVPRKGRAKAAPAAAEDGADAQPALPGTERPPDEAPDGPLQFRVFATPGKSQEKDGRPKGVTWDVKARLLAFHADRHLEAAALIGETVRLRVVDGKQEETPKVLAVRSSLDKHQAVKLEVLLSGNTHSPQLLGKTVTLERVQEALPLGKTA